MMREDIGLFRGKRLDNGEWVEGYLVVTPEDKEGKEFAYWIISGLDYMGSIYDAPMAAHLVDSATVGEYTGLKDVDDKRVFEDDIIGEVDIIDGHIEGKGVVKYGRFNCGCCHGVYGWYIEGKCDIRNFIDAYWVKKLGNIHDNPELLEV